MHNFRSVRDFLENDDNRTGLFLFIIILVIVVMFLTAALYRHQETTKIQQVFWQQGYALERYEVVKHEGWDLPPGAVVFGRESRYHHTNRWVCGRDSRTSTYTDSKGRSQTRTTYTNRYCSTSVYRDWYFYTLNEWVFYKWLANKGYDKNPVWPNTDDWPKEQPNIIGKIRLGAPRTLYQLFFMNEKKEKVIYDVNFPVWNTFDVGDTAKVTYDLFGHPIQIEKGW